MEISYNFIRYLLSEEIDIQPAFFAIFRECDTAGDSFVIALHVEIMAYVGIILFFVGIALAASHKFFSSSHIILRYASVTSVAFLRHDVLKFGPEFCAPSPQLPK